MSSRDWLFRIKDILHALEKIETYIEGMTLSQFKKNEMVIDAVIRNIEIIGEASKSIPLTIRRKYPEIPWGELYFSFCSKRALCSNLSLGYWSDF